MSFEQWGVVIEVLLLVLGFLGFYFKQKFHNDSQHERTRDSIIEVKDHLVEQLNGVRVTQGQHGVRLDAVEGGVKEVKRRLNMHVNGVHPGES